MKFLRRNKKIILLVLSITCAALIFTSTFFNLNFFGDSLGFIFIPVGKFFSVSSNWIGHKFTLVTNIFEVENENIKLKNETEQYNLNLQKFKMLEDENKKLSSLLNVSSHYENYKMTAANVIAKDTGNWFTIFIIDKGLKNGLKNNMVVMSTDGLVGKITECRNNFSKVSSIIDDKSSVSIKNFRTGDLGFAKGNLELKNDGFCLVEFLDNTAQVVEGDEIITSQLSEIFPPGLLVGHIHKIISNCGEKSVTLETAADLKHLDKVLVITKIFDTREVFNMEE